MNPSLQKRLAVGLAIVLIPVFLGQWLMMSLAVQRINADYITARLNHDAEALFAALQFAGDTQEPPQLLSARVSPIYRRPWSGHYYRIQAGEAVFRSRSLWDGELTVPAVPSGTEAVDTVQGPRNEPLLVLTRHFYRQNQAITILVAEEISLSAQMVGKVQFWYAVVAVLAVVLLLVLQRVMVKRSVRPLGRAREEMRRLEQGFAHPLSTAAVPVEILPFIDEINRLLATMAGQLQKSREASGNLAHTIRTPLTVLLQLTENPVLDAHPAFRQQLQQQITTVDRLTNRVLKRARVAGAATPALPISLDTELANLVAMLQHMHDRRAIRIEAHIPTGVSAAMDREDLLELVGNLLDNACKWARTTVRLTVLPTLGVQFTLEDDGPGCPPEHYAHILERGGRADPSTPGHGLGLTIAQEIVTAYGGRILFGRSELLGGFQVQVQLDIPGGTPSLPGAPVVDQSRETPG